VVFAVVLVALVLAIFLVQVPAIQGGIVGGLLGLLSSQAALFVARYLRERGEVVIEVKGWIGSSRTSFPNGNISQATARELDSASEQRQFEVRVRNTKDVSVSLWDFSVVLSRGGQQVYSLDAHDTISELRLDLLNIPAQEAVLRVVRISVSESAEKLRQAYDADKVEMTVTVAGEGQRSRDLPRWSDPDIK